MTDIKSKQKQHYVPQFYLKNWIGRDGIWVNHKSEINKPPYAKKSTKDVGEERYFYGSLIDDVVYDMLVYKYSERLKNNDKLLHSILSEFKKFQLIDDIAYKKKGIIFNDKHTINKLEQLYDVFKKNFLEDKYSNIENTLSKSINQFNELNSTLIETFIPNGTFESLLAFYCFQLHRTPKALATFQNAISSFSIIKNEIESELTNIQKKSLIQYILYIDSFLLAERLAKENYSIRIFKNRTKKRFITSDSPSVIIFKDNIFGFIPLTPKLLMQIEKGNTFNNVNPNRISIDYLFSSEKVSIINGIIHEQSDRYLYARSKNDFLAKKEK
ncbi:hypothetical protein AM394_07515 [Klebsiella oxytoca]|nr:hypothetical protein AM394_07515 [Klebsiella oxytoca]HBS6387706.1 DUF4238 domain-containing protein [Klebsiella pneumoniae]HCT5763964.1 DUF4238 domain-containing protein [Klebsiella variicola]